MISSIKSDQIVEKNERIPKKINNTLLLQESMMKSTIKKITFKENLTDSIAKATEFIKSVPKKK